ncbi:MAG: VCBS repeat-containing protein [Planctomycetota bacterium]|nr:VCBS repeat-containing protein [Planctomycetota bacterium]
MPIQPLCYSLDRYITLPLKIGFNARPTPVDWRDEGEPDLLIAHTGGIEGRGVSLFRVVERDKAGMPIYDEGMFIKHFGPATAVTAWPNGYASRFDIICVYNGCLWKYPNIGSHDSPWFGTPACYPLPPEIVALGEVTKLCPVDVDRSGALDLLLGVLSYKDYFPGETRGWGACSVGIDAAGKNIALDENGQWKGGPVHGYAIWMKNHRNHADPDFSLAGPLLQDGRPIDFGCVPSPVSIEWNYDGLPDLIAPEASGDLSQRLSSLEFGLRQIESSHNVLFSGKSNLPSPYRSPVIAALDLERLHRNDLVLGTRDGAIAAIVTEDDSIGGTKFGAPGALHSFARVIHLGEAPVPVAVDWNGNGVLDLLVGKADGSIDFIENEGTNAKPDFSTPKPFRLDGKPYRSQTGDQGTILGPVDAGYGYACPEIVDWNGDGKFDLVLNDFAGRIRVLPNSGTAKQPKFSEEVPILKMGKPLETLWRVKPACVDWTGDGKPDLLALDAYGFLNLHQRDGEFSVKPGRRLLDHLGRPIQLDGSYANSGRANLAACDFDGDGDVDILVGVTQHNTHILNNLFGGAEFFGRPSILLLENTGSNENPVFQPRIVKTLEGPLSFSTYSVSACAVNWTGSAKPDLLVGCDNGWLYLVRGDEWFV